MTGANSGIGFAIARACAAEGATVVLAARNEEKGTSAVYLLSGESGWCAGQTFSVDGGLSVLK